MAGQLVIERRGPVSVLVLYNPDKRNALDPELCRALAAAVTALEREGVRAAVLTGDGDKAFCSGFDLDALQNPEDPAAAEAPFTALLEAIAASNIPIVAALNGAVVGGGCELAAACDFRVAHGDVTFLLPPARIGIVYAARGLARFSALIGESRARLMFLAARAVKAPDAHRWGLVDELVEADAVQTFALALAHEVAVLAPLAVQGMRRTFEALLARRAALEGPVAADIAARREQAFRSEDAREGRAAIARRRPPRFTGR